MGMDFVALLKYGGPDERLRAVLDELEAGSPPEVQAWAQAWGLRPNEEPATWQYHNRPELLDPRLDRRPALPDLRVLLRLPEEFCLTFGADAVEVYHPLRWYHFLTEPALQRPMLDACAELAEWLGASDCVLTSDLSPIIRGFREGMSFDAALASVGPEDGERPHLRDLFLDRPDGWSSRGYWRLSLAGRPERLTGPGRFLASPVRRRRTPLPGLMGPSEWGTGGEPRVMLESLLRWEAVSRRKVRLWACACARRILPLVGSERGRAAVEAVERFVEGRAPIQEAYERGRAVPNVRKGSRHAKEAVWRTAMLCLPSYEFPPSQASEAAAEAVAEAAGDPSAGVAERRVQADLLRDVFGPRPFQPMPIDPSWLAWNDGTVPRLAQTIYEGPHSPDGALDASHLALLADALLDAGTDQEELLAHLREPGVIHVRGCWALDLLLGKA